MAGFKGRQRNSGQQGGYPPHYGQQAPPGPYGNPGYGPGQDAGPGAGRSAGQGPGRGPGPGVGTPGGYADPYFDARGHGQAPSGEPEYYSPESAPEYSESPGGTKEFTFGGDAALGDPQPADPNAYYGGDDHVATYRAGLASTPPAGPRLHWKDLLRGIVLHPSQTFWQMRDHTVWAPALTVTFVYGLLAVFGFDAARSDILSATLSTSVPWVLITGFAVVLCGFTLSAVTNTLARQLGGDGSWGPTVGLAMLITSLTDAPRLLFALFLGGGNSFVQLLGWLTWLACAWLLASMVSKSHDLPWLKALGASSIQLLALLALFKLPLI